MLAFPELIVVASTPSGLLATKELLGLEPPTELVDWLKRWKTPAQAEAGLVSLPALPSCVVLPLADVLVSLSALAKHGEGTRFLFLLESPERHLAQSLPPSGGLPAWVQTWMGRHRELLKQLQRLRANSLAVDLDEWLAEPGRLAGLCPALPALKAQQVSRVPAALTRLVAGAQLRGESALLALGQELFDACTPLQPVASKPELALAQWQAARAAEDAMPVLQQRAERIEELICERDQLRGELAELALLKPQLVAMREELQSLCERLQPAELAQAELEKLRPEFKALDAQLAAEQLKARDQLAELNRVLQDKDSAQQALQTQFDALRVELDRLLDELRTANLALEDRERQLLEQRGTAQVLQAEHEASLQQARLLTAQLEELRKQLIPAFEQRISQAATALLAEQEQAHELRIDLQAASLSCEALSVERDALRAEQYQLKQAAEQQALELRNARNEVQLLTLQAQQLQTELLPRLEQRFRDGEESLRLEREKSTRLLLDLHALQQDLQQQADSTETLWRLQGLAADAPACVLDQVAVELQREAAPHCELHLQLQGLRLGQRRIDQAGIRLLEHAGHVGLALYSDTVGGPLLSTWREDAREGERGLMLLLPETEAGLALLQRLPTSDWDRLLLLIARLQLVLEQDPAWRGTRWPAVAARLLRLIQEQPPRLRYDALQLERDGEAWRLRFVNALFGQRRGTNLALSWQVDVGRMTLLSAPVPPLSAWPRDAQGGLLAEAELPVGASAASPAALPASDRELLQALLDALPAAAAQEPALAEAVHRLQQDWLRRTAPAGRLRRLLRRLRGGR